MTALTGMPLVLGRAVQTSRDGRLRLPSTRHLLPLACDNGAIRVRGRATQQWLSFTTAAASRSRRAGGVAGECDASIVLFVLLGLLASFAGEQTGGFAAC